MKMAKVVGLKRKPRPLKKTYQPAAPYVVERHDQEDGSIQYEIWDHRPDSYRRLCTIAEDYNPDDIEAEEDSDRGRAKSDAELVARGLNMLVQYGIEKR